MPELWFEVAGDTGYHVTVNYGVNRVDQAAAHGLPEERVVEDVILAPQAVKRLLEPEEVAEAAAFLLGPGGRAVTGTPFLMDQGWTAR